jgi:hypothetical protein
MRADAKYALIAALALGVLLALGLSLSGPLLYTLEKDTFPSRFHDNTGVLKMQALNSTTDVLPLMRDLLGYSGPVVVSIRSHDIAQARRDLELFAKSRISLNNLIVKLDMSGSEMQEFSNSKELQQQLLTELLNSSVSLDALENLEIRYRDQNNPDMLVSVQYEGDALRKKVQELYNQYQVETGKATAISTKFGLDTSKEETGLVDFEQYVKEIDRNRNQQDALNRIIEFPIRRSARLSFLMSPDNGVYGDRIECFGYYFSLYGYRVEGVPGKEVTVFLDNAPVSSTITDELGSYNVIIPIERIPAVPHSLYAQSGTTLSDIQTLTVQSVGSTTTLSVTRPDNKGDVTCTGSVTANRPVRSAPVQLVWDTTHITETSTDAQGQFKATLRFPEGRHTVVARFSGEGFPITPSESMPQVVEVSILRIIPADMQIIPADNTWGILLAVAGTILLFIGIAGYYLKREPGRRTFGLLMRAEPSSPGTPATDLLPPDVEPGADEPGQPSAGTSPPPDESVLARYARILKAEGLSAAAWVVYRQFAGRVANELFIPKHTALTPRELSHSCTKRPFCRAFSSFVSTYERIRYGGQRSVAMQEEFETRIHATQSELEGGSP